MAQISCFRSISCLQSQQETENMCVKFWSGRFNGNALTVTTCNYITQFAVLNAHS